HRRAPHPGGNGPRVPQHPQSPGRRARARRHRRAGGGAGAVEPGRGDHGSRALIPEALPRSTHGRPARAASFLALHFLSCARGPVLQAGSVAAGSGRYNPRRTHRFSETCMTTLCRSLLAATCAAALGAFATPAPAQTTPLKLHHFLGPKAPAHTRMLAPWAERVEKASGGKVKIELYPSMALGGKPPQLINQARDGVVDIIWTVNGYTAGLFPRSEVFELPFIHTNDPAATNLAMRAMYDQHLKQDYRGVQPLFLHVHAGQAIHMVDKEVRKPEDLQGL